MFIRWSGNMPIVHAKFDKKISFTFIFESPYWLNNFLKHHPSYELIRPEFCQSYLFAFFSNCFLSYVSLNFFGCLYFSISWPWNWPNCVAFVMNAIIFIYFPFWPFSQNNVEIVQHRTLQERCQAAEMLKKSSGCSTPILVDTMDNEATEAYGAYPERLFIIQDRKIVYEGGTGPYNYKLGEVKKWLEVYKASR